jgi:hypothetical protein
MKNFNYLIYFSLVFLLTSCAVGRKISYQNENTLLLYKPSKSIVVTFYDQRKEIVNGKENPSFSGHLNATLQIPYNINTQSGNTLAEDFAKSVSNAISKQTQQSIVITLAHADSITKALKALQNSEYDLLLLFTIHKWKNDAVPGFSNIHYQSIGDFELNIFDKKENIIANAHAKDILEFKKDLAVNIKTMQKMSDDLFSKLILELFNNNQIRKAID